MEGLVEVFSKGADVEIMRARSAIFTPKSMS